MFATFSEILAERCSTSRRLVHRLAVTLLALPIALCSSSAVSHANPQEVKDHIKFTLRVNGDSDQDSHVSIRFGSPDFSDREYFPRWDVGRGEEDSKEVDVADDTSEFELQTQGGHVTGYSLIVEIDGKQAIICKFNARPDGSTQFVNLGVVHTQRSSDLNSYGEGNSHIIRLTESGGVSLRRCVTRDNRFRNRHGLASFSSPVRLNIGFGGPHV